MSHVETRGALKRFDQTIASLYAEADVPPPTSVCPVTPLGPILERLAVSCVELPGLTARSADAYLLRRRALRESLQISDDRDEPLSGFLYAVGDMAFLFVNKNDSVTRRRFSVAHELGHLLLHFRPALRNWRDAVQNSPDTFRPGLFDAFSHTSDEGDETARLEEREREANAFAACLLVAGDVLRLRREALQFIRSRVTLSDRLANEFLVSRAALQNRINFIDGVAGGTGAAQGRDN